MTQHIITEIHKAVLAAIEQDMSLTPGTLFIDTKAKDLPAVFYEVNGLSACVCAIGSHYWNEMQAQVEAAVLIARVVRKGSKGESNE